ncbi:hypothetical protein [Hymenobacter psoromatis]|uniref:hypothetical protein n=1 Tax=Hymenobacter psoromatis TaxID=1484116 RepID=UPI001CBC02B3|nr:hypothetical protein [Hymenobacter psoromatis]
MPTPYQPYRNESFNTIYNLLFCDDLALYKTDNQSTAYPWVALLADAPDHPALRQVAHDTQLEARARLLAYRRLLALGDPEPTKELLGVVVEVGLPGGLDVLAAYPDGSARYLNQAEKLLVWDAATPDSTRLIEQLLAASRQVARQIGPWLEARRPYPPAGAVRLTFLMSDGLYFGEGPFEVLQADPLGGPVIAAATQLLVFLTKYGQPAA